MPPFRPSTAQVDSLHRFAGRRSMSARARSAGWSLGRWLAIYLVVLQSVLSGLAAGAMAAPGSADAFTLCLSGTSDSDAGTDHGGGVPAHATHDCMACPLAGGTPVLPQWALAAGPRAFSTDIATIRPVAAPRAPVPLFESARPRAPPAIG